MQKEQILCNGPEAADSAGGPNSHRMPVYSQAWITPPSSHHRSLAAPRCRPWALLTWPTWSALMELRGESMRGFDLAVAKVSTLTLVVGKVRTCL